MINRNRLLPGNNECLRFWICFKWSCEFTKAAKWKTVWRGVYCIFIHPSQRILGCSGTTSVCHSGLDWWGDDSGTAIVAWQKEAAVDQRVAHSAYRPVYMVTTAKEQEDGRGWQEWWDAVRDKVDAVTWERGVKDQERMESGSRWELVLRRVLTCLRLWADKKDYGVRQEATLALAALSLSDSNLPPGSCKLFILGSCPHPLLHLLILFLSHFSSASLYSEKSNMCSGPPSLTTEARAATHLFLQATKSKNIKRRKLIFH